MTTSARDQMTAKIQARTTDQLFADLAHLETLPKTPETRLVGAAIADVITEREGIDEQLDLIFGDVDYDGTYLEAMLIAVARKHVDDTAAAPVVEPYRLTTPSGRHIRWATRVTVAGRTIDFDGKLPKGAAIRQAEEHIGREQGHAAFHAGRGNFPLEDGLIARICAGAKVGEKTHVLEAFNRSWTRANLAAPVNP